jgi:hypothetical protein
MDGVGLPAYWSPSNDLTAELSPIGMQKDDQAATHENDIGTPFSTWLPSAHANDQSQDQPPNKGM